MTPATTRSKQLLLGGLFVGLLLLALAFSSYLSNSDTAVLIVEEAGYLGLVVLGIIGGLNLFVPIPAAVFTELYTAAGLQPIGIIIALAVGTLIADLLGYWFGKLLRTPATNSYPKVVSFVTRLREQYRPLIIPFVAIYAAFVPFPNEAILIPLAVSGIKIRHLLMPLIIGNVIHQTILVYGLQGVLRLLG